MTKGLYRISRALLFSAAAWPVSAGELPRIGGQVLGSRPTGSMRSEYASDTGYGVGVFADWEVGLGKNLRVGYDGVWYPTASRPVSVNGLVQANVPTDSDVKSRSHAFTAQYLCYPGRESEGFYYKAGLGAMNYLSRVSANGGPTQLQETGIRLACLAGVGYDFGEHWGVMAQYSFMTVNNHTLGAVQTGVTFRF